MCKCRTNPKRLGDTLLQDTEESSTTYNMLKVSIYQFLQTYLWNFLFWRLIALPFHRLLDTCLDGRRAWLMPITMREHSPMEFLVSKEELNLEWFSISFRCKLEDQRVKAHGDGVLPSSHFGVAWELVIFSYLRVTNSPTLIMLINTFQLLQQSSHLQSWVIRYILKSQMKQHSMWFNMFQAL